MTFANEPIAVIGSGCRFPGEASDPSKLWDLLREPRDVLRKLDRFRAENFHNKDGHYHGASNVLSAYLLAEDTKLFDTQFFNIPLSEAEAIDPQQRLLMETVYESLEAAGLSVESLSGSKTAAYVGVMCDDFSQIVYGDSENVPTYAATGSARSILSNRISYFFNWHGPSMTIDTACSSSLIAVHQAVQALRSGESPVAIAAGTNLIFGPTMFVAESNLNMLSPTGRSQMWDAGANGYARGEGVGSVVMKTLSAALRDGDHIEYLIRETGLNQDGKTPGITMPSSEMQAELIRDTYARAGLDPTTRSGRCQYFEAHGTGTPAGDPQEAGAIHKAFFGTKGVQAGDDEFEDENLLYVGSIKTIIGHTEGTAGIAGLMKASLAIQNKMIPPNMHFNKLNPALEPYYDNLKVPVQLREWPKLPDGIPRRASVNSFGFGGANAHAIIESYEPDHPAPTQPVEASASALTPYPFVFSATSEKSLAAQLQSFIAFLSKNTDFNLGILSWSLFRRTAFTFRITFSATSIESLVSQMETALEEVETKKSSLGARVNLKAPRHVLGVFTGQGAQWATMGRELILSSPSAESVIDDLEKSLSDLPDGPEWSLKAEMLASKETSRIAEGVISQPLCTAVQIMVVEILRQAGVQFGAVVGHSSGEIACAFVSGFLSARDAIRVAYYRGKYTALAKGGAMIAVGTDMQDANDLCSLPKLKGRAQLAASNSSASVTVSGDGDAIDLVEMVMQDESKFARKLKIDTAYHSFHMEVCAGPYIDSLNKCVIQIMEPAVDACPWYSSVTETNERVTMDRASELSSVYWRDNMLQSVLFSQALKAALVSSGTPGVVIEVGPHPALKGPASLTIEETVGSAVPYVGTITRGQNDALALAVTMGSLWTSLGAGSLNLQGFQRAFNADTNFEVSKTLPGYAWDHDRVVWNETRASKAHRLRAHAKHELLGVRLTDEVEGELRWRNYLKPQEMPWLRGHQIQGQMVFPAAGFAVMALEAARNLAPYETIRLMELQEFSIHKALSFMDDNANVEIIFTLSNVIKNAPAGDEPAFASAEFSCYACMNKEAGEFTSMASGRVKLCLGTPTDDVLPERPRWANNFVNTNIEYFYESLATLGYGYSGMFQGVTDLQRTNGGSKGIITIPEDDDSAPQNWVIHPATLDVAFQAVFAAVGAPGDGRLWTLHVPTMINSITVNPSACDISSGVETPLPFDACLADTTDDEGIAGDVDIYDEHGRHAIVQIQGLHVTPLTKPSAADDRDTFGAVTWDHAAADMAADWTEWYSTEDEDKIALFAERLSLFILRELSETADARKVESVGTEHQRAVLEWARHVVQSTRDGEHAVCPKAWLADTWEVLGKPAERLARTNTQISSCLWVKARLGPFMSGELSFEDELEDSPFLGDTLSQITGFDAYNNRLGNLVKQISFKYRNLKVLEIGAGRGSSTKAVLAALGDNFTSYTVTDVDATHFDGIRAGVSGPQNDKIVFKALDIEHDTTEQGFASGYYDLIIAGNTLHSTPDLDAALKNARGLLRTGAFIAIIEPTSSKSLAISLSGCVRPYWYSGIEEGRRYSPIASQKSWDDVLRNTGFSGIDTATPEERNFAVPFSVMCSMATDNHMEKVRDPLAHANAHETSDDALLILGGKTVHVNRLVRGLTKLLKPFFKNIIHCETVVDVDDDILAAQPTTVSLLELDEPLFKPFTEAKFNAVVKLCDNLKEMLWITIGSRGENPYMNMMVGVGRCLVGEMPNLRLQFLNFDGNDRPTPEVAAHHLLRLHLTHHYSGESTKAGEPLYPIERELTIQNGTLLIPRYLPVDDINTRLNSDKRLITHDVNQAAIAVKMECSASGYKLLESLQPNVEGDMVLVTVSKALLSAIHVGSAGCLHVLLGRVESGKKVVALSETNQSIVSIPRRSVVEVMVQDGDEASLLHQTGAELLAATILSGHSGSVLVHEPSSALVKSLSSLATKMDKALDLTSVHSTTGGVRRLHAFSTDRVLAQAVPTNTSIFANLSQTKESNVVGSRLESLLPFGCETKGLSQLYSSKSFRTGVDEGNLLQDAVNRALLSMDQAMKPPQVIRASIAAAYDSQPAGLQVVDWKTDTTLPVAHTPADESIRFRNDRTYFFVGLTGELGLQLTKWMVRRGAKYLALASRSPKLNPEWLELVQSSGAVVKAYAMDVTSRASVRAVHKQITAEMPPVAGVANGAMILIDGLFANKSHAEFDRTLRPKVDGTVFLDEVFPKNDLDFFIVFSSLACVSGNMGQTAYAAANAFMCSLVAGRRMRGLAGSAVNMPGIVGLGYLNRDPRKLDRLKNVGYVNISEWEFYQFLSEAIVAGRPDSGRNPEITAGLQRIDVERHPNPPIWAKTPRFHWLRMVTPAGDVTVDGEKDNSSVRSRLPEMKSEAEVHNLLLEGLLNTLYSNLNMNPDQRGITPDTSIVELGVDSLLAVDMRSWFTKELDLDMPVLKILGGATVQELVEDAVKRLPSELRPKLTEDGEENDAKSDAEPEVEAVKEDTVETEFAAPDAIADINATADIAEETLVIAPIDLPSFEDPAEGSMASSINQLPSTDDDGVSDSSRGVSASEDDGVSAATTSSDVDSDEERKPQDVELGTDVEVFNKPGSNPAATLFSNMPDQIGDQPKFIKKVKMSYGTSRFWFLMQFLEDPTTFNLMCHIECTGNIRYEDADRCVRELGNRHEAFRTAFFADPEKMDEPTMGVLEETPLRLERRTAVSKAEVDAEAEEILHYEYKIDQGETIRIKMISIDDNTHHVLFGFHHIAMDGFSFNLLLAEINMLYDREPLSPVSMQFSDFATRQRLQVENGSLENELQFWKDTYSITSPSGEVKPDFPEPLPLFSLAKSLRKSLDNYEYEESKVTLDARTVRQIKAQCRRAKITTFHFFLGVLRTFLFRQLDVEDLVIGIADANRVDNALDTTMGFMLNLLPLRFRNTESDKSASFKDIALDARNVAYSALSHSKMPFDALLEKLGIPRSTTNSPLFQVWMDYRPFKPDYRPTMFGGEASGTPTVGRNGYDLTLDVNEVDGSDIRVSFRTQKYLYSAESTQLLFDSYMRLVKAFASSFETHVDSVSLWNSRDTEAATALGRGPRLQLEWPETLSHRITDAAAHNPTKEAVKDADGQSFTYEQLQARVQSISEALTKAGAKQRSRVAVFQQPTADWIVSLLAIWHAGATYIPMDLRSSLPRLAAVAQTAKPAVILCHSQTENLVSELETSAAVVNVSDVSDATGASAKSRAKANDPAAILFTSGSTGTPKGVVLSHSSFRNTIEGLTKQYGIGAEKVLQQSAFTFDFSLDQILCGLVNGGSVHVVSKEGRMDPVAISKMIVAEDITYTRATPSEYASWITHGSPDLAKASLWRFAWAGGEVMPKLLRNNFENLDLPNLKLYNSYGPAESITCTKIEIPYIGDVDDEDDIPAGLPLPNYTVYIVDHSLQLVPQGVAGEILIAGPSVSMGYLNNEKLSETKFINNAYSPADGRVVYRTGDIGSLRADGALLFHGRIAGDTQVKIRGIRIDLEDIESSIVSTAEGALDRAVVTVRKGDLLVAHVQFAPDQYPNEDEQKAFLRSLRFMLPLPLYMMPATIIPIGHLPVNSHGKTDRAAVQALELSQADGGRTAEDLTETEAKLVEIWIDVVPEDAAQTIEVSSQTSFFELGGNSLLLVKLQILITTKFNAKLSLVDLFGAASLGAMASKIESAPPADFVDWEAETSLDNDIAEATAGTLIGTNPVKTSHRSVLITGATGFVGQRFVQDLAASADVAEIHCIAVRPSSENRVGDATGKVKTYPGDLAAPRLGLTEETFNDLSNNVDLIIHAGVARSLFDTYQQLRGPNLESTKSLVRLAAPRQIPVHFVSSGAVLGLAESTPATTSLEGYVASKWASEKYLHNAAKKASIPIAIHRIVPPADASDVTDELVAHLHEISTKIKAVPAVQAGPDVELDLVRADSLAQKMGAAFLASISDGEPEVEYQSDATVNMSSVVPRVVDGENSSLPTMPLIQWIARARDAGLQWQITSMDQALFGHREGGV